MAENRALGAPLSRGLRQSAIAAKRPRSRSFRSAAFWAGIGLFPLGFKPGQTAIGSREIAEKAIRVDIIVSRCLLGGPVGADMYIAAVTAVRLREDDIRNFLFYSIS